MTTETKPEPVQMPLFPEYEAMMARIFSHNDIKTVKKAVKTVAKRVKSKKV